MNRSQYAAPRVLHSRLATVDMKEGLGAELSERLTCTGYGNKAVRAAAQRRTTWLINLKWSTKAPVCPGN